MNTDGVKLVLWGWGFEFGRYFCGGAPAVPVIWQWYLGVHYHWFRPKGCGGGRIWWFSRNFYFGKPHNPTPAREVKYRQAVGATLKKLEKQ
jgi:hypothetical protein